MYIEAASQISRLKSQIVLMLFEEFFKKKKIDLAALQKDESALYAEFETHFEQMGEKSFDHTKKYWFNKLRRRFPLAPEIKTEKVHMANPIAEQTVTESLIEAVTAAPKLGFAPKFKANLAKPAETVEDKKEVAPTPKADPLESATPPAHKVGFVPRFKAANMAKPAEVAEEKKEEQETPKAEPVENPKPAPKVGFVPRFKAANMAKPAGVNEDNKDESEAPKTEPFENAAPAPKLGFTPKFKTAATAKPAEITENNKDDAAEENPSLNSAANTEAKPVYKPRFNMKNIPPKSQE